MAILDPPFSILDLVNAARLASEVFLSSLLTKSLGMLRVLQHERRNI